jgi:hypothetical protein
VDLLEANNFFLLKNQELQILHLSLDKQEILAVLLVVIFHHLLEEVVGGAGGVGQDGSVPKGGDGGIGLQIRISGSPTESTQPVGTPGPNPGGGYFEVEVVELLQTLLDLP